MLHVVMLSAVMLNVVMYRRKTFTAQAPEINDGKREWFGNLLFDVKTCGQCCKQFYGCKLQLQQK
jgi:hypothetical protein